MNKRQKGLIFQNELKVFLESIGWTVANFPIGAKYNRTPDVFGADMVAKRRSILCTYWIQASADRNPSIIHYVEKFRKVPFEPMFDRVFIFIRRKPHRIEVMEFHSIPALTTEKRETTRTGDFFRDDRVSPWVWKAHKETDRAIWGEDKDIKAEVRGGK